MVEREGGRAMRVTALVATQIAGGGRQRSGLIMMKRWRWIGQESPLTMKSARQRVCVRWGLHGEAQGSTE
jgi:hypothetical protein